VIASQFDLIELLQLVGDAEAAAQVLSLLLRYWYNSTNAAPARRRRRGCGAGTHFTTALLVQRYQYWYSVYYCVTGTTVQILTQQAMHPAVLRAAARRARRRTGATVLFFVFLFF
jgi:hypothetical protein